MVHCFNILLGPPRLKKRLPQNTSKLNQQNFYQKGKKWATTAPEGWESATVGWKAAISE